MEFCIFYRLKIDGLILSTGSYNSMETERKEWSKKLNVPEKSIKIESFLATI